MLESKIFLFLKIFHSFLINHVAFLYIILVIQKIVYRSVQFLNPLKFPYNLFPRI